MLSVLTETPGTTAPMHASILPPTFHASWPPPQGSDTSAPGKARQMAFTISRLIGSSFPFYNPVHPRATDWPAASSSSISTKGCRAGAVGPAAGSPVGRVSHTDPGRGVITGPEHQQRREPPARLGTKSRTGAWPEDIALPDYDPAQPSDRPQFGCVLTPMGKHAAR